MLQNMKRSGLECDIITHLQPIQVIKSGMEQDLIIV